jgi:hypothetical protein
MSCFCLTVCLTISICLALAVCLTFLFNALATLTLAGRLSVHQQARSIKNSEVFLNANFRFGSQYRMHSSADLLE